MQIEFSVLLFQAFLWALLLGAFGLRQAIAALIGVLVTGGLHLGLLAADLALKGTVAAYSELGFLLAVAMTPAIMVAAIGASIGLTLNILLADLFNRKFETRADRFEPKHDAPPEPEPEAPVVGKGNYLKSE
jgi:hypothetical protein